MVNSRLMVAFAIVVVAHIVVGVAVYRSYRSSSPGDLPPVVEDNPGKVLGTETARTAPETASERPKEPPAREEIVYVVRPGDTYWEIARRYGVSVKALQTHNGHDARHVLKVNDRLRIPPK